MSTERRRYFRIEDEVSLACRLIEADKLDATLNDFWQNEHEHSIRNNYNFQIEQHIADFHKIQNKNPELARYLEVLEKQIDRITDKLIGDEFDQSLTTCEASLSAQGIAFEQENAFADDSLIELSLKLLPSGLRLVIIARVVQSEPVDDGRHKLSLDFEHLHEADRELLIKHIHGKQMESLSVAREV